MMEQVDKIYLAIKERAITFPGSHEVHTPRALVDKILRELDLTGTVLVLFNIEFVASLVYTYKVPASQLTFFSDHDTKSKLAQRMGVKYISTLGTNMKFDVAVGNPPYTKGQVMLYAKFFESSLEMADKVAFVMPVNTQSRHDKLKFHNERVLKHQILVSDNISDHFNVGYDNLHYVIASKKVENKVEENVDPLDSIPLLFPERARLAPIKGDTDIAIGEEVVGGVNTIFKVHKNDQVIYRTVDKAKVEKSSKKSKAPYLVVVNHTPSKGKFNCAVLPNTGLAWSMWTFAFEVNSQQEGEKLKSWLTSELIIKTIDEMLKARNGQHTISKAMIERLPSYA